LLISSLGATARLAPCKLHNSLILFCFQLTNKHTLYFPSDHRCFPFTCCTQPPTHSACSTPQITPPTPFTSLTPPPTHTHTTRSIVSCSGIVAWTDRTTTGPSASGVHFDNNTWVLRAPPGSDPNVWWWCNQTDPHVNVSKNGVCGGLTWEEWVGQGQDTGGRLVLVPEIGGYCGGDHY
jgi:hypothetical protein